MKEILIARANSYIGSNLEKWLEQYPDKYSITFWGGSSAGILSLSAQFANICLIDKYLT